MESQQTLSLVFNADGQNALIGFLLTDPKFFLQCLGKIQPHFFTTEHKNVVLYKTMIKLYNDTKKIPLLGDIEHHPIVFEEFKTDEKRIKFSNHIQICINSAKNGYMSLDFVKAGITGWMQGNLFRELSVPAVAAFNSGKVDKAFELIETLNEKKKLTAFEDNNQIKFSGYREYLKEAEEEFDKAIPTGLKLLDEALLGPGAKGGFLPGDMTIVLASTDAGKTSFVMTVAAHNLLSGKHVFYETFEGVPTDLRIRLLCSMVSIQDYKNVKPGELLTGQEGVDKIGLFKMAQTVEGQKRLDSLVALMDSNLVYSPLNRPGMTIEDVVPIIEREQDKHLSERGKYFDLICSDYPAKLQTRAGLSGNQQNHLSLSRVYDAYVQLAIQYRCHTLCPIQTNREGFKINHAQKGFEERLLGPNDFSESFAVSMLATNIISINRTAEDGAKNRAIYYVAKSKNSSTGTAVVVRTRYNHRVTHADSLGAVAYRSSSKMTGKIDAILTNPGMNGRLVELSEIIAMGADKEGID